MYRLSILALSISLLALDPAPAYSKSAGMSLCLTPGYCQPNQWRKAIFPLHFRPVTGCFAKPALVRSGPYRKAVALTFDDGPSDFTPPLLRTLRRLRVKASFFMVGRMIPGREWMLKSAYRDGHVLGNHSFSHPQMPSLAPAAQDQELSTVNRMIKRVSGYRPCLMRPPYGLIDQPLAEQVRRNYLQPVLWDVDAADWERPPAQAITARVLAEVRPGSIILLHDGGGERTQTVAAIPGIVKGLRSRGFRLVTLPRLLGLRERR